MVINVGALLEGRDDYVRDEVSALAKAAHARGAILKVILETCLLPGCPRCCAGTCCTPNARCAQTTRLCALASCAWRARPTL